jgi:uncharacterized protein (TIGR02001 family)
MRKLLIYSAILAGAAGPAFAQEMTFSGNIAAATDYTFRGLSQTDEGPAIQGGLDGSIGGFYVGTWASNVDLGFDDSIELDIYTGYKFAVGPVALDVGVIGYLYPGAADDGISQNTGELDYYEGFVKGSVSPANGLTLGGAAYFSPEFTGETGEAYYLELNGAYAFTSNFSVSGAYGYQDIDNVFGIFSLGGGTSDSYSTYNVGATVTALDLGFDLRYVGTSIDAGDPIIAALFTTEAKSDDRVVFSIKKAM